MGFVSFLLLGLLAGTIAKAIWPGKQSGSWARALLLGVAGALLGGWLGGVLFSVDLNSVFDVSTWLLAIGGSTILLMIFGLIARRSTT